MKHRFLLLPVFIPAKEVHWFAAYAAGHHEVVLVPARPLLPLPEALALNSLAGGIQLGHELAFRNP